MSEVLTKLIASARPYIKGSLCRLDSEVIGSGLIPRFRVATRPHIYKQWGMHHVQNGRVRGIGKTAQEAWKSFQAQLSFDAKTWPDRQYKPPVI